MSDDQDPSWKTGSFSGPNEKLLSVATKLTQLTKLAINTEVEKLQAHIRSEAAANGNHPLLLQLLDDISSLKVK